MPSAAPAVVGIDVAKAELVIAIRPSGERWTMANDAAGIQTLVKRLRGQAPALIILEATGGYERATVAALAAARLPLVVANPHQVRDFARATGPLAKTDRIDADILALFAERVRPAPRALLDDAANALDALLTRRRVLEMLIAERNRLEHALPAVRRGITQHIGWLERQLRDVDREGGRSRDRAACQSKNSGRPRVEPGASTTVFDNAWAPGYDSRRRGRRLACDSLATPGCGHRLGGGGHGRLPVTSTSCSRPPSGSGCSWRPSASAC